MKILLFLCILLSTSQLFANLSLDEITVFSLKKNANESVVLKNTAHPTVVIFISKDCPCSKGNLDYINQLSLEYKNMNFIGIHSKKNTLPEDVLAYLQDKKLNFEIYNDSDLKITDLFKALKTPHAFIVSTNGEVVYNGGVSNSTFPKNAKEFFLKDALTDIQNNKLPSKAETKTLGCFIVR
ncbi:MAG: hypothetical protein EHM20_17550 [Alphaproteobacteria bacterium]|nr:MAG: hypothetical protein EHM20_17550 [Alphaproteobacteria bacterium]